MRDVVHRSSIRGLRGRSHTRRRRGTETDVYTDADAYTDTYTYTDANTDAYAYADAYADAYANTDAYTECMFTV
jgi:hypothetical protein